jgi:hypothetical protein
MARRGGRGRKKIPVRVNLTTAKNNAGNIGHPANLNNAGVIKVKINKKK